MIVLFTLVNNIFYSLWRYNLQPKGLMKWNIVTWNIKLKSFNISFMGEALHGDYTENITYINIFFITWWSISTNINNEIFHLLKRMLQDERQIIFKEIVKHEKKFNFHSFRFYYEHSATNARIHTVTACLFFSLILLILVKYKKFLQGQVTWLLLRPWITSPCFSLCWNRFHHSLVTQPFSSL